MGIKKETSLGRSGLWGQWEGTDEEVTHTVFCLKHPGTASGEGFPWNKVQAVVLSMHGGRMAGWWLM